ncbi:flagellar basal body rod protein FlgB [Sansalvadorimonas sp. 2012CJ34-2]|uniref:Flagellar basal body rod protein FlgB n=1 Tax=Parendozoicomonas callyspongiae TaxID=2942213 RepID=A0ABT0PFU1_9GAMM|nr:flagellar basal body rod protein FlgB [Sansalvadorimonas sp. 2012CJ34-2]MCL6270106.1 flagellar basal body rod protein FlgB [Sansalvadorimonas sp. 2012CJ34-2]
MAISFDNYLGLHQQALEFRSQRAEVIAGNLANVDTPGYTAKDLDFSKALEQAREQLSLAKGNELHIQQVNSPVAPEVVERTETQPSADGNTVELSKEQAAWAENRAQWEASFTFLNQKFRGLEQAING